MHAARVHAQNREPAAQIVEQRQSAGAGHAVKPQIVLQRAVVAAEAAMGPSPAKPEIRIGGGEILPSRTNGGW
jgi:hypothetical protein